MTPRIPSEPSSSRSGEGPAPEPGSRRDAQVPLGRDRADGLDEVVDVRRAGGEVPARARGDPAAERRELEGLREEAHGQAVGAELLLQARARRAGADARRARDRVDLEHAVERAEVERDGAVERARDPRLDAADDARAAAVGDDGDVRARRPLEHGLDLALVARAGDEVGDVLVAPAEAADRVDVGLAEAWQARSRSSAEQIARQVRRARDARRGQRGRRAAAPRPRSSRSRAARRGRAPPRAPRPRDHRVLEAPAPAVACAPASIRPARARCR